MKRPIILSFPNLRTCTVGIVTNRGATQDQIPGATQILLQTMTRETYNYSEQQIARKIDGKGGSLFTLVEKDFAVIGAQTHPKYAEETLDLLFDMTENPSLNPKHIEIETQNLIQVYQRIMANALQRLIFFEADKAVFGEGNPYSQSLIGNLKSLKSISSENLHQILPDFLIEPWGFAIGYLPKDIRKKLDEKILSRLIEDKSKLTTKKNNTSGQMVHKRLITSSTKEDENAYICLNIAIDMQTSRLGCVRFSSGILGESYGSRMFTVLRDKKSFGYLTGSVIKLLANKIILRCFMETKPVRATEAIESLTDLIYDLVEKEISITEYETTKNYLLGMQDLSLDDSRIITSRIINRKVHGLSPNIKDSYKEIEQVTPKKLHKLWQSIFKPENISLAISGDIDPKEIENHWQNQLK